MLVAPGQVARVLQNTESLAGLMLFGDDPGLIRTRAQTAVHALLGGIDDPFRVSVLSRDEHGSLSAEANSLSLSRGRRAIRVLDAGDGLVPALSNLSDCTTALVILECPLLPRRSKLRAFAEKRPDWAAVSCQTLAPAALAAEVQAVLGRAGYSIQRDTLEALAALLPSDSAGRQAELEKIIVYAGPGASVVQRDALSCCANPADIVLADLFHAVLTGNVDDAADLLSRTLEDGATGPGLLAAFGFHLHRILKLRILIDEGKSAEAACAMLFPPVYPRQAASLIRQVRGWTQTALQHVFSRLRQADMACKQAGSRDATISAQLMMATARRNQPGRN